MRWFRKRRKLIWLIFRDLLPVLSLRYEGEYIFQKAAKMKASSLAVSRKGVCIVLDRQFTPNIKIQRWKPSKSKFSTLSSCSWEQLQDLRIMVGDKAVISMIIGLKPSNFTSFFQHYLNFNTLVICRGKFEAK